MAEEEEAFAARSGSVEGLLRRTGSDGSVTSGVLIDELLGTHRGQYLGYEFTRESVGARGPSRTVAEHVAMAERRWDAGQITKFHTGHLVLALAMDPDVGWPMLRSGTIATILARWQPGPPDTLAWDLLSQQGRDLAEEQPLLAAAFGAPPEWTADLPEPVTLLALSPAADRVAVLAGGTVYEVRKTRKRSAPRRVNDVDGQVVSLGWGRDGIVALRLAGDTAEITQVATGSGRGTANGVMGGRLGSAGLPAWLEQSPGVIRSWALGNAQESVAMTPPGSVLAVDGTGRRGLVNVAGQAVVVSTLTEDEDFALPPGSTPGPPPNWPSDMANVIGVGAPPSGPLALLALGKRAAVASAAPAGGVVIGELSAPPAAYLATGPGTITALAADSAGHTLAVAIGGHVSVWPLGRARPAAQSIPRYDADSRANVDLLEADRDAFALASLIASRDLGSPLAIGLFGDWGSGKTFVLDRIEAMLKKLRRDPADGYLKAVYPIRFNAWHYAETNLWASLVDRVLTKILSKMRKEAIPAIPEVVEAKNLAESAAKESAQVDEALEQAKCDVKEAKEKVVRQRRTAWWLGIGLLLLAVAAVIVAAAGESARIVAAVGILVALVGSVSAAVVQFMQVSDQAQDIVKAGRTGLGVFSRVSGRTARMAARAAVMKQQELAEKQKAAEENATRLREKADRAEARAKDDVVGTVLGQLSSVTEYREQLSLVTRTRERFGELNKAISKEKRAKRERFVILIDDLDRCAPENVVKVLEAVHLLFNFEMFVVVLAVDTRWLAQSLKIRYRQLLGGRSDSAGPYDYLEKIIQIPIHLLPLDDALVRTMITGLTGLPLSPPAESDHAPPPPPNKNPDRNAEVLAGNGQAGGLAAEHKRTSRESLPAEILKITQDEATAMSAVAPLVGTTPRTVKRFVNTYRLLKARADDPAEFAHLQGSIGDHEVVAFLLAVVTGRPTVYRRLLPALKCAPDSATLRSVMAGLSPAGETDPALADVLAWLGSYPRYAGAPAHRYAKWVTEVARFSFIPATTDIGQHAVPAR